MYDIYFSNSFIKSLRKLVKNDSRLREKIKKQIKILRTDPRHPSLRLHKLSGKNHWSVSVSESIRIIFTIDEQGILLNRIGTHDEVY